MRKSREVKLTLLAAAALSVTACRDQRRDCVDAQSRLQPDSVCRAGSTPGAHYIYGGASGGHMGDYVLGGSTTPRGGFGGFGGCCGGDAAGE